MAKNSAPDIVALSPTQLEELLAKVSGLLPAEIYRLVEKCLRTLQWVRRYNAHEDLLDSFSRLLRAEAVRLHAVYDLLVPGSENVLLVEAKTIRDDARQQVRTALRQLFYYEYFDVSPLHPGKKVLRLLLTDRRLSDDLQGFLTKNQVGAVWIPERGPVGGTKAGLAYLLQYARLP